MNSLVESLDHYMDLNATYPVFGVFDKARLKLVSSATETSLKIEILLVASLDMVLSKKVNNKGTDQSAADVQAGLRLCCTQTPKTSFLAPRPICTNLNSICGTFVGYISSQTFSYRGVVCVSPALINLPGTSLHGEP